MREAGKILASLYRDVRREVVEGVTGRELNDWFAREIKARGAHASYLDPEVNFPGVICISVNDMVVHGVPNDIPLEKGDVVSFDLVIDVGGMKADSAFTMLTDDEKPTGAKKLLLSTTERSLYAGIDAIKGAVRTGDIGAAVQEVLEKAHLVLFAIWLVMALAEPCTRIQMCLTMVIATVVTLVPVGNALAIEPMATLGSWKVVQD